jgi:hypothetical protein
MTTPPWPANCSSDRKGLLGERIGCPSIHSAMNKFASCAIGTAVMAAGFGLAGLGAATEAQAQPAPPPPIPTHPEVAAHLPVRTHPAEAIHPAEASHLAEATHPGEATREADTEGVKPRYREFSSQSSGFGQAARNCLGAPGKTVCITAPADAGCPARQVRFCGAV